MQKTVHFICLLLLIEHVTALQFTTFTEGNVCNVGSISGRFQPGYDEKPPSCSVSGDGKRARCDRLRDWTSVQNVSSGVLELSITGWLYRIPNDTFRHLPDLEILRITDAAVVCADPCAFCGLPNLRGLDLTSNLIQPSHYPFITASLAGKHLDFLYLDGQRALEELKNEPKFDRAALKAFDRNLTIDFLSLTHNKLADMQPRWLSYLKDVHCLSMAWNKLDLFRPWGPNVQIMYGLHEMRSLNMLDFSFQAVVGDQPFEFDFRESRKADCRQAIEDYRDRKCQCKIWTINELKKLPPGVKAFSDLPPQLTRLYLEQEGTGIRAQVGKINNILVFPQCFISVVSVSYNNLLFNQAGSMCVIRDAVLGLGCLREFYSRGCSVVDIQEQAVTKLSNIEVIDFGYGQINAPMLTRPLFRSHKRLHTLQLEGCGLTCQGINRNDSFIISSSLHTLNLAENSIDCFPTSLIEQLPSLTNLNMFGHQAKWFNGEAMVLIDKRLKESNGSVTGKISLDIRGAFHCTCDKGSLDFFSWYKKRTNTLVNGNLTTCRLENDTVVLLVDLDLDSLHQKCAKEPSLHSLPTATYISISVVALALVATVVGVAANRAKIWYSCLTAIIRWRNRRDSSFELDRLMSDGTDHVMLVYHPSDGFAVNDIRLSLLKKRCPVFDLDTGLNFSVDESGRAVPADSDWNRAGGFHSETFVRGLLESSVVVIMTSPSAVLDSDFRFNVNLVKEHLYRSRHLRVILIRREHHLESAAFSWSTISGLRSRERVKNWVLADGDRRRLARRVRRIVALRDSCEPRGDETLEPRWN